MTINGKEVLGKEGMSLRDYLESEQYALLLIAVELNEKIIPKAEYGTTILKKEDCLEVVSFVGGG